MHIGDSDTYLDIRPAENASSTAIFSIRAKQTDTLSEAAIRNDAIVFDSSDAVRESLDRFASLKEHSVVLPMGGGKIQMDRDRHGAITVTFRVPTWEARGFLEGEVRVDGEFAGSLVGSAQKLLA